MSGAAAPTGRAVEGGLRALRAFIVEDSPVILELLVTTLSEMLDVEVVGTAVDEATVVAWMQSPDAARADVLIVDLFLARGSGLSVLQSARDLGLRADRIVLTNYATPVVRERCSRLGAMKVFDKSTELYDLIRFLGDLRASA